MAKTTKKTTKKTAQANARSAKAREAIPVLPPYAGFEPYDVVQVSENETTWTDFETIRTEAEGDQALKMCELTGARLYRIVSGDKQTVKVEPSASKTKPKAPKSQKKATSEAKPATETKAATPKKLSALDAAAKVLADTGEPMNAKQMIEAMTTQGFWKSPGGKTPHATLYSAILREISTKAAEARFQKTSKGHFAAKA